MSNATTPNNFIDEVLKSEAEITFDAHKTVCPIITADDRSEPVDNLLSINKDLTNIFKKKMASLEALKSLSFDELLARLTKQNNMEIINSVADHLGLGVPKLVQVKTLKLKSF